MVEIVEETSHASLNAGVTTTDSPSAPQLEGTSSDRCSAVFSAPAWSCSNMAVLQTAVRRAAPLHLLCIYMPSSPAEVLAMTNGILIQALLNLNVAPYDSDVSHTHTEPPLAGMLGNTTPADTIFCETMGWSCPLARCVCSNLQHPSRCQSRPQRSKTGYGSSSYAWVCQAGRSSKR